MLFTNHSLMYVLIMRQCRYLAREHSPCTFQIKLIFSSFYTLHFHYSVNAQFLLLLISKKEKQCFLKLPLLLNKNKYAKTLSTQCRHSSEYKVAVINTFITLATDCLSCLYYLSALHNEVITQNYGKVHFCLSWLYDIM